MSSKMQAEAAVAKIVQALVVAWNAHDARAFAGSFAEDADFTNVFGMRAKRREMIEQFHRPIFETVFKDSQLTATDIRVRCIRPDVVAADVQWEMTGARDPMGNDWTLRRGLINMLVTLENNGWSIAVMHNMDLQSPEMAAVQSKLQQEPT